MSVTFNCVKDFDDFAKDHMALKDRIKALEAENYELEKKNLELRSELENLIITQLPIRKEMSI